MSNKIFREEALAAQNDRVIGNVFDARTTARHVIVPAIVVIFSLLCTFLIFAEFSSTERVRGYIVSSKGVIKFTLPQRGTLVKVNAQQGKRLLAGDEIVWLDYEQNIDGNVRLESAVIDSLTMRKTNLFASRANEERLAEENRKGQTEKLKALSSYISQIEELKDLQQQRVRNLERELEQQTRLQKSGFLTESHLQPVRDSLLEQQLKLTELAQQSISRRADLDLARRVLSTIELEKNSKLSGVDRAMREIDQQTLEHQARRRTLITTPVSGYVSSIRGKEGQLLPEGSVVATLIPDGSVFEAELIVPTRASGFIKPGQKVTTRLEAFPFQRYGTVKGIVKSVESNLVDPNDTEIPLKFKEPSYKVRIALSVQTITAGGAKAAFREGMILDADIEIERRSLLRWFWDPIAELTQLY